MKTSSRLVLFFLLVMITFAYSRPNYYLALGISKPFAPEEFKENWRTGYTVNGAIGLPITSKLEIQGDLLYDNFSLHDLRYLESINESSEYASVSGGTAHLISFYINSKYRVPPQNPKKTIPYLTAGVGLSSRTYAERQVYDEEGYYIIEKETENVPAAGLGIGFEIEMSENTVLYLEGRFNVLFTKDYSVYFPLKFGVAFK